MADVKVFVSYSWGVESKTGIVDAIERFCPERDIELVRDKNAMQHGDVIMDFMKDLTSGDHIITVFSKPYFRSPWCMYELLKIWQKGDFLQRTHALFADDCNLQDAVYRIGIVKYWIGEHEKIKELLEGVDPALLGKEYERANMIRDIAQNASEIVNFAAGRLTTPLPDLREQNYVQILDRISLISISEISQGEQTYRGGQVMEEYQARKISNLERQIRSIEQTLHNFEMEWIDAYHHAQKNSLQKDIAEKKQQLKAKNIEYEALLKPGLEVGFSDEEAEPILAEIVEVVEKQPPGLPEEMMEQIVLIREAIQEQDKQDKSATAKLKVILPIVPGLVVKELDLDLEKFFGEVWGKVRGLLKDKADIVNPN